MDSDHFVVIKEEAIVVGHQPSGWIFAGQFLENVASDNPVLVPTEYRLDQVYPNPFNSSTVIRIEIPESSWLQVIAYNAIGQHVSTLANSVYEAGYHSHTLDASHLSTSIYFIQASVPGKWSEVRKVVLVK